MYLSLSLYIYIYKSIGAQQVIPAPDILYHTILYYDLQVYTILNDATMLCCAMLYYTTLYYTVNYFTIYVGVGSAELQVRGKYRILLTHDKYQLASGAVMYARSKPKRSPHFDQNPYHIPTTYQSISYTKHMGSVGFC